MNNFSKPKLVRQLALCLISVLLGGILVTIGLRLVSVAQAAGFTVNSTADTVDASPGDGVCETGPSNGICTLRGAIQEANASAGEDTIALPAGVYTLTIAGMSEEAAATGDLDIVDDLVINGAGASTTIIDGNGLDRVFDVDNGGGPTPINVTISGVTIRNGASSSNGGGIINDGEVLTVTNSMIISNATAAGNDGGGIGNVNSGVVTILGSSIISNTAVGGGGDGGGISSSGTLTVTNSTLSGNVAADNGGGLRNVGGAVALINSTIVSNTANTGGGGFEGGGLSISDTITLTNTIVAFSTPQNCSSSGTLTSGGNNLSDTATCNLVGAGDVITSTGVLLEPLADNGGSTLTHALLPGSAGFDAGNNTVCAASPVNNVDQRGITRPQGATCDIGAFEVEYNDAPVNSVPGTQSVNEDAVKVFSSGAGNAISVSDADAGSSPISVTLTATNGTVTLATTSGLTFSAGDGTGDTTTTFTGTITAANTALNGLSFTPPADYNGAASLQIIADDQGNTGLGGALSDNDTVAITVNPVNDAPGFTKGADQTVSEDAGAQSVTGWASGFAPGGGADEASQTVLAYLVSNDNNALFAAQPAIATNGTLTFTPAANVYGSATVTVQVQDSGGTANGGVDTSVAQTFSVTVTAVNDAPVNTVPGTQNTITGAALVFSSGNGNQISLADLDAGSNPIGVTLTATSGTITLATTTGLAFSAGDGTGDATMTFTGTSAAINAALNGLSFLPTSGFYGAASLQLITDDQGNTGAGGPKSDTDTVVITVNAYLIYLPLVIKQP